MLEKQMSLQQVSPVENILSPFGMVKTVTFKISYHLLFWR